MGELESLRQKVAEAVARRDAATPGPWFKFSDRTLEGVPYHGVTLDRLISIETPKAEDAKFIEAHHADIETMQALLVRLEALEADKAKLREEGQAIVARWDTPTWKDAEHTGVFISRMRQALKDTSDE